MKTLKMLVLASLVSLGLPVALHAEGDWSPPLNLFDRSTLAGWGYGSTDHSGWTMKDGVLHADSPKSPLVAGWTFGDFELEFKWSVATKSNLVIALDGLLAGPLPRLMFTGGPKAEIAIGPGGMVEIAAPAVAERQTSVRRQGAKLAVAVNGQQLYVCDVDAQARFTPEFSVDEQRDAKGSAKLWDLRVREPVGQPIFNGRDLTGWWSPGNLASWPVIDDNLVCINQKGDYLRTENEYGNFLLSFDYKMAKRGNSGVGIRTPRDGWPSAEGMELQIQDDPLDDPLERHQMMSIYGRIEPLARADRSEEWNHVVIRAEGRIISAWVNGVLTQQYDTESNPDLKYRPLKGWIGFQDHGARTEFHDVRVLELPERLGSSLRRQRMTRASAVAVNRLMNLDTLAGKNEVASSTCHVHVDDNQEHTLLDTTGSGAIVGIYRSGEHGTLSFYFDGQPQPALTCAAKDLVRHLPLLAPDQQPIATFVPYNSALKVTLRDGAGADYRIDCVTDSGVNWADTFNGPDKTLARGMVSTVTRRYEELGYGGHREHDGLTHFTSETKTIERGQSVPLVELNGSGIVEWWKLKASNKVLSEDNLWLQVTVDGETKPAVEAPARFFFPGLPNQRNYQNFVATQRNGFINLLAMPYRAGLKISAVNRGKKAIKDIRLTVSTQVLEDASQVPPLRLHGLFATASQPEIVNQSGHGRWIGLVYGLSQEPLPEVAGLVVDGQPRDGWSASSLADILGVSNATGEVQERHALCGRDAKLAWRWLLLAPVDFHESLVLKAAASQKLNDRLALFYLEK